MNIEEIRKWHKVFKRDDELFEVRLLGERTWSGYFYDVEQAIEQLKPYDNLNIYFSVNEVKRACASRSQFGQFQQVKGTATSKQDIAHRWWIPIDVDCERPSGVSSTDAEKELAHRKAGAVFRFLKDNGFSEPVICDSSSGYHIFLPIDMENTTEAEAIIKTFLETLGNRFTDEHVKIDNVLFDANRIIRLPGSFGRKGRNTDERPHRQAKILSVPKEIVRVGKGFINTFNERYKVVAEQPTRNYTGYNGGTHREFSLRGFINEHGISVHKEIALAGGGTKYVLTECIFDSGHKAPDAAIFEMPNGAIAYKCFHQSCACHDWREVRQKFDPHAYEQRQQYRPLSLAQNMPASTSVPQPTIKPETPELGKKWRSLKDIKKINIEDMPHFYTGFTELDRMLHGLFFSEVTIVSGTNASGKSSWLNTLSLNIVQQGYKVAMWSGELRADVLKTWVHMVAAGGENILESQKGYWYVPQNVGERIDDWLDGKFYLYNNEYSNKWEQIYNDMEEMLASGVKVFILDNLMSMDIDILGGDNNQKQKAMINKLVAFTKQKKVHIILVAHPRKVATFVRKEDISGSSDLVNAIDNLLIIHRTNEDFRRRSIEYFGKWVEKYHTYGNVIEVAKNRMMGVQDFFCGMHYDVKSRRFKNYDYENVRYGWQDFPKEGALFGDNNMPLGEPAQEAPF